MTRQDKWAVAGIVAILGLTVACGPATREGRAETVKLEVEHDGCKVYSFQSANGTTVYFAKCAGTSTTNFRVPSGKTSHQVVVETHYDRQ